jgi:hypothetical protein
MSLNKSTTFIIFALICTAAGEIVSAQSTESSPVAKALRPHQFSLMPWDQMRRIDGPEDKVHGMASLVDCNFTYAGFVPVADLAACDKLGLKAIVQPERDLGRPMPDDKIEQEVRKLIDQTKNSPACVGYYIRDEPDASHFAHLGKVVAAVRRHAPDKLAYINLFPGYATPKQLGAKNFTEYLERYAAEVKPQFLSYDNYMVQISKDLVDAKRAAIYFRDLMEVRRVSLEHGLPFWNIVAGLQIRPEASRPSPANLLLQGWTTLAAGGRGVSWFKYKQQKDYSYGAIDMQHRRGITWNYLQMVNRQLQVIGPIVAGLKSDGVYFTAPAPLEKGPLLPGKIVKKLDADGPLMLGEFSSKGEAVDHLVLVNLSLQRTTIVRLKDLLALGKLEAYSPEDGHLEKCNPNLHLTAGQGVLIKLTR